MATGEIQFRKKLTREQFRMFMSKLAPSVVIFEACGSANYWAGQMEAMGHQAKLIAPQFVRPFVKRHKKNDAADADAIIVAARQPEMRFVMPKTVDQQARAALFRGRERLIRQRTEDVNALRAILYEHGHVFPIGMWQLIISKSYACRPSTASMISWPGCARPRTRITSNIFCG